MTKRADLWLLGMGASLVVIALFVARWECPSEVTEFAQFMQAASLLAIAGAVALYAGVYLWMGRL